MSTAAATPAPSKSATATASAPAPVKGPPVPAAMIAPKFMIGKPADDAAVHSNGKYRDIDAGAPVDMAIIGDDSDDDEAAAVAAAIAASTATASATGTAAAPDSKSNTKKAVAAAANPAAAAAAAAAVLGTPLWSPPETAATATNTTAAAASSFSTAAAAAKPVAKQREGMFLSPKVVSALAGGGGVGPSPSPPPPAIATTAAADGSVSPPPDASNAGTATPSLVRATSDGKASPHWLAAASASYDPYHYPSASASASATSPSASQQARIATQAQATANALATYDPNSRSAPAAAHSHTHTRGGSDVLEYRPSAGGDALQSSLDKLVMHPHSLTRSSPAVQPTDTKHSGGGGGSGDGADYASYDVLTAAGTPAAAPKLNSQRLSQIQSIGGEEYDSIIPKPTPAPAPAAAPSAAASASATEALSYQTLPAPIAIPLASASASASAASNRFVSVSVGSPASSANERFAKLTAAAASPTASGVAPTPVRSSSLGGTTVGADLLSKPLPPLAANWQTADLSFWPPDALNSAVVSIGTRAIMIGGRAQPPAFSSSAAAFAASVANSVLITAYALDLSTIDHAPAAKRNAASPSSSTFTAAAAEKASLTSRITSFFGFGSSSSADEPPASTATSAGAAAAAAGCWTSMTVSGAVPSYRFGHAVTPIDGVSLLLFGGFDPTNNYGDTYLLQINGLQQSASAAGGNTAKAPKQRKQKKAATKSSKMVSMMGDDDSDDNASAGAAAAGESIPLTGHWVEHKSGSVAPSFRAYHSLVSIQTVPGVAATTTAALLFGGCVCERGVYRHHNDLYRFDTQRRLWSIQSTTGTPPAPRSQHSASVLDAKMYVFGGTDSTQVFNDLHALDLTTYQWTKLKPISRRVPDLTPDMWNDAADGDVPPNLQKLTPQPYRTFKCHRPMRPLRITPPAAAAAVSSAAAPNARSATAPVAAEAEAATALVVVGNLHSGRDRQSIQVRLFSPHTGRWGLVVATAVSGANTTPARTDQKSAAAKDSAASVPEANYNPEIVVVGDVVYVILGSCIYKLSLAAAITEINRGTKAVATASASATPAAGAVMRAISDPTASPASGSASTPAIVAADIKQKHVLPATLQVRNQVLGDLRSFDARWLNPVRMVRQSTLSTSMLNKAAGAKRESPPAAGDQKHSREPEFVGWSGDYDKPLLGEDAAPAASGFGSSSSSGSGTAKPNRQSAANAAASNSSSLASSAASSASSSGSGSAASPVIMPQQSAFPPPRLVSPPNSPPPPAAASAAAAPVSSLGLGSPVRSLVDNVYAWSVDDVVQWLSGLDAVFARYVPQFRAASIDGQKLVSLTDETLKSVTGVDSPAHRRTLTGDITGLKLMASAASSTGSSLQYTSTAPRAGSASASGSAARDVKSAPISADASASGAKGGTAAVIPLLRYSALTQIERLGEGSFGITYRCFWHEQKKSVVLKVPKGKAGHDEWNELQAFLDIPPHANVIPLIGLCTGLATTACVLVTPFMRRGSLRGILTNDQLYTELFGSSVRDHVRTIHRIAYDIACGTAHLHAHQIVHRDLATRNILTGDDGRMLVSDFGLSRHLSENDTTADGHAAYYRMSSPTLLPIRWLAPESMEDLVFTVHSDTWMFGVCIWEIFVRSRSVPYAQIENLNKVLVQVSTGRVKLQFPDWTPAPTRDVLMKCFRLEPAERPSMQTLALEFKRLMDADDERDEQLRAVAAEAAPKSGVFLPIEATPPTAAAAPAAATPAAESAAAALEAEAYSSIEVGSNSYGIIPPSASYSVLAAPSKPTAKKK